MNKKYGWRRSLPDPRDYKYTLPVHTMIDLPNKFNLIDKCPPVWDQGELGSCTAHGACFVYKFNQEQEKLTDYDPSRLYVYYNTRVIEGTVDSDSGAEIRNAIKSIVQYGVCRNDLMPYDIKKFTQKPSDAAYQNGKLHHATEYARVPQDIQHIKTILAVQQRPIVFGFSVFSNFESDEVARTGKLNLPSPDDSMEGGHCVAIVGYDDTIDGGVVFIRNSWGNKWGLPEYPGYFTMPYKYVLNPDLADDFWFVSNVQHSG